MGRLRDAPGGAWARRDRRDQAAIAVRGRPPARRRPREAGGVVRAFRRGRRVGARRRALRRQHLDLRAARSAAGRLCWPKGSSRQRTIWLHLRAAGADAVLLLLRDLDDETAARLQARARTLGLDALVEAHDSDELARAVRLGADPIGINARDLATFSIDRRTQLELVATAPRDRMIVAESGVETRVHGVEAELAGADAILVGSALMRASDPGAALGSLLARPVVKVCGLTRQEDVDAAVAAGADLCGFILAPESPRATEAVLDVGGSALSVAVLVGEPKQNGADLVQLYEREDGTVRGRDAVLLRSGVQVATVVDLPWADEDSTHLRSRAGGRGAADAGGGIEPGERRRGDRCRPALGRGRELQPRVGTRNQGPRARARIRGSRADMTEGWFGEYGGRFVPETLVPALDELEAGWQEASADPSFAAELDALGREYAGRPTPLTLAERFLPGTAPVPQARGPAAHGRAQDQQRAGAGRARAPLGKPRIIAETGAGQHGVAAATVCARFGLECVVYMGEEDMRAPAPERRAHGPAGRRGSPGRLRHAHAEGGDERGHSRLDHERPHDALPHRLVRRPAPVSHHRPRAAGRDRARGARAVPRAPRAGCQTRSWPASAAARTRSASSPASSTTRTSAGRRGGGGTAASLAARPRRRAARSAVARCSPTPTARSRTRTRSPPGSTTPASGPSTRSSAIPVARST